MITVRIEGLDALKKSLEEKLGPKAMESKIRKGMRAAKPEIKAALGKEMRRAYDVKKVQFAEKTWRISTGNSVMTIQSLVKWFGAQGDTIVPRGHRALLIPINTYLSSRITTKKFYSIVAWLRQENLSVIKGGILYAKPVWNTSKRGGVKVGTRINKQFRRRFQGTLKRPSGFSLTDIKVIDGERLVPIAVLRRSVRMPKRFDLVGLARSRLVNIAARHIESELIK